MKETRELSKQLIYMHYIDNKKFLNLKNEMAKLFKKLDDKNIERSFN